MERSFAAGECPNCGHDWTAHSSFIARGEKVCEEFDPFLDEREYEDAHPNYQEDAQALIGRMCEAPLVIQYEGDDEIIHTDERPFCDDPNCPCHFDPDEGWTSCWGPYMAGLFTPQEATRFWQGRQV